MVINLILRLTIWLLLTADFSGLNICLGLVITLLLPWGQPSREKFRDWCQVLGKIFLAIPQAYLEALEMIFRPHNHEEFTLEQVKPGRSPRLIFLDIFLITFTPKTIVWHYYQRGWYGVHRVMRRVKP